MDKTGIEWTDDTWNPLRGCSLVSDGCRNCYAMGVAGRFSGPGMPYEGLTMKTTQGHKWTGKIALVPEKLLEPMRKSRSRRIFVNSMSDLFHEDVPDDFIDHVFAVMALSPQHTFQVLTKRPERMRDYLSNEHRASYVEGRAKRIAREDGRPIPPGKALKWPLPHVWIGVSVEDQKTANQRIPILLDTPAAVLWLSMEPLLGPVSFRWAPWVDSAVMHANYGAHNHLDGLRHIDWVVIGGESGPNARPMHPDWARALRDQCAEAKVPFLFKQWGEWQPREWCKDGGTHAMHKKAPEYGVFQKLSHHPDSLERVGADEGWQAFAKVGKKAAGRSLDGVQHDGYPEVCK